MKDVAVTEAFQKAQTCWAHYGTAEPYWSVLTDPKFKMETLGGAALEEFWASGKDNVDMIESLLHHVGSTLVGKTVLDFGCGTGRMTWAAAQKAHRVIGVDVSAGHLDRARARVAECALSNVEWVQLSDPFAPLPGPYDVAYSLMVLQHNRPPLMKHMVRRLLEGLKPGGVAVLHIPTHIGHHGATRDPHTMEMHGVPSAELETIATEMQSPIVRVEPIDFCGGGIQNAIFLFQKNQ